MVWAISHRRCSVIVRLNASLGKRLSIDNKQHGVLVGPVLAVEITQFSF
jgi:hypothetical protein